MKYKLFNNCIKNHLIFTLIYYYINHYNNNNKK